MVADIISFIASSLVITLLVAYLFALWAALLAWTWMDISSRTNNELYRLGSLLIVATGAMLGFAVYLLLRPTYTKDEAEMRDMEEALLISQSHLQACPQCNFIIKEDFSYCSNCSKKLKIGCSSCSQELIILWSFCPYCGSKQKETEEVKPVISPVRVGLKDRSLVFFSTISSIIKNINASKKENVAKPKQTALPKNKKRKRKPKR